MSDKSRKAAKEDKKAAKAARKRERAERKAAGAAGHPAEGALAGYLAGLTEQPQLALTALATIGTGIVTRRPELTRGGARMLAVYAVATGIREAVGSRLAPARREGGEAGGAGRSDGEGAGATTAAEHHHLTDVVVGGLVGWLSEAVVGAIFDRIEPAVERRVRDLPSTRS